MWFELSAGLVLRLESFDPSVMLQQLYRYTEVFCLIQNIIQIANCFPNPQVLWQDLWATHLQGWGLGLLLNYSEPDNKWICELNC